MSCRKNEYIQRYFDSIIRLMATEIYPIKQYLRNGVVIDAGANKGLWSAALALYASNSVGKIELFEPQSEAKQVISNILGEIDDCPDWNLNTLGVGDYEREEKIYFDIGASELATFVGQSTRLARQDVELGQFELVNVVTLDGFCLSRGYEEIDYLKLDVEGFEMQALQGASELLSSKKIKALSFEFGLNHIGRNTFREFWDFLTGYGYNISLMKRGDGGFDRRPITEYITHLERFDWNRYYIAELA